MNQHNLPMHLPTPLTTIIIAVGLVFSSCAGAETDSQQSTPSVTSQSTSTAMEASTALPAADVALFHELLEIVLDLKTPLAADDLAGTDQTVDRALEVLNGTELPWAVELKKGFDAMRTATTLDSKRIPFETVSNHMIELAASHPPADGTLYVQSCPMVRGGSADWLSREAEIRNPYHGDRMLRCGMVKAQIAAAS